MTDTYTYKTSIDFTGGLNFQQLANQIVSSPSINKNLTSFTNMKNFEDITFVFDDVLDAVEDAALFDIISSYAYEEPVLSIETTIVDELEYSDYAAHFTTHMISGDVFSMGVERDLTNWTYLSGTLPGFDAITGVMTFEKEGIYCFGLTALVQTVGNNNNIAINIYDGSGMDRFIQTQELNNLASGAPGGGCTFTAPNYMAAGETLTVEVEFAQNETCDFVLRIIKMI